MLQKITRLVLIPVSLLAISNLNAQNTLIASNEGIVKVSTDENGITIETRIVIEKEKEMAKIIFWQETQNGFFFKDANWKGNVILNLENGSSITLIDRNLKGHDMEPGGHIAGYFVPDVYQRYSAYYLTDAECQQLKKYRLSSVDYHLDDEFETETKTLSLNDENQNLKAQILAIGK